MALDNLSGDVLLCKANFSPSSGGIGAISRRPFTASLPPRLRLNDFIMAFSSDREAVNEVTRKIAVYCS